MSTNGAFLIITLMCGVAGLVFRSVDTSQNSKADALWYRRLGFWLLIIALSSTCILVGRVTVTGDFSKPHANASGLRSFLPPFKNP